MNYAIIEHKEHGDFYVMIFDVNHEVQDSEILNSWIEVAGFCQRYEVDVTCS